MHSLRRALVCAFCLVLSGLSHSDHALARDLRLATTTSTENSGLLEYLLPEFEASSGIQVHVISVGTGKALKLGENGDVDVILVHSRPDEERFVAQGHGVNRREVMFNDFVIVGPASDPAMLRGGHDAMAAFGAIMQSGAAFISRGDESGTHKMELRYWSKLSISADDNPAYRAAGRGMGEVLLMASELGAYSLTDRATFYAMQEKLDLEILVEGDTGLFNPYGVIAVNPQKYPDINYQSALTFIDWITSAAGQDAIAAFEVGGQQLFFPNAQH